MATANVQGQSNVIDLISDAEEESEDEPVIDLTEEENAPKSQQPPPVLTQSKVTKAVAPVKKAVTPVKKAVTPVNKAVAPVNKSVAPVNKAVTPVKKPHVITVNYQSQPALGKFTKTLVATTGSTISNVTYQNKAAAGNNVVKTSQQSPEKQIVEKAPTDQQNTATTSYSRPKIVYDTEINNIDLTGDDVEEPSPSPKPSNSQPKQGSFTVTRKYVQLTKETVLQKVTKSNDAAATGASQPGIRLNQETVLHPVTKRNIGMKIDPPKIIIKNHTLPTAKRSPTVLVKSASTTVPVKGTVTAVPVKVTAARGTVTKPVSKPQNKPLGTLQNEERSGKLKKTVQGSREIQEIRQTRDVLEIESPPQQVQQQTRALQAGSVHQDSLAGAPQNHPTSNANSISAPSFNVSAAVPAAFPPNIGQPIMGQPILGQPNMGQPILGQANMGQGQSIFLLPNNGSNVQVLPIQLLSGMQNGNNNNQQQIFLISVPNMNANNGPGGGGGQPQFIALPQNFMSAYNNNGDGSQQQTQQMNFIPVVSANPSAPTIPPNYNNNSDGSRAQQSQEMNFVPMVAANSVPATPMNQALPKRRANVEMAGQLPPPLLGIPQNNFVAPTTTTNDSQQSREPPKQSGPAVMKVFPHKKVTPDKANAEDCIPMYMCSKDAKTPDETEEEEEEVTVKQPTSRRKGIKTNLAKNSKQRGLLAANNNASTNPNTNQALFHTNLQQQQQQPQQHMPGIPQTLPGTSLSRSTRDLAGPGFGASSAPTRNFPRFCPPIEAQAGVQMRPASYTTDVDPLAFDSTPEWMHDRPTPQYPPVSRPAERETTTGVAAAIPANVNSAPIKAVGPVAQVKVPNDPLNVQNRSQPAANFVDINSLDDPSDPLNLDNSEYSEDPDKIRYEIVRDQDGRITGVRSVEKKITTDDAVQANTMTLLDQVYPTPSSTPVVPPKKRTETEQETLADDNLMRLTLPPPLANILPSKTLSKEMREHNYSSKHPEPDLTFIREYKKNANVKRRGRRPNILASAPDVRPSIPATRPEIRPESNHPLDVNVAESSAPRNSRRTSDPLRIDDSSAKESDPLNVDLTTGSDRRKNKGKRKSGDRLNVSEATFETQFQKNLQTVISHQEMTKRKKVIPPDGTDSGSGHSDLRNTNFMSEITNFKKHMPKSSLKRRVSPETNRDSSDSATLSSDSTDVLLAKRKATEAKQISKRKEMHLKSQKQKDLLAEENARKPDKSSFKTIETETNKEEPVLRRKRGRPSSKKLETVLDVIPEKDQMKPSRPSSSLGRTSNAKSEIGRDSRVLHPKPGRPKTRLNKTCGDIADKEIDQDDVPLLQRKSDVLPSNSNKSDKISPGTEIDMDEPVVKRKRGRPSVSRIQVARIEPVKFIRRMKRILRSKISRTTREPAADSVPPPVTSQVIKSTAPVKPAAPVRPAKPVRSTKPVKEIEPKVLSVASPEKSSERNKPVEEEYFLGFTSTEINTSLIYSKKVASATKYEFSIAIESTTKSTVCGDYCRKRLGYFGRKASKYEKTLGIKRGRGRKPKRGRKMKDKMEYYRELRDALSRVDNLGRPSIIRYPVLRLNILRTGDREERKSRNNVIIRLQSKRRFKKKGEPRHRTREKASQDPEHKHANIKQKLEEDADSVPAKKHKGQTEKYVKTILEEHPESVTEAMTVQLLKPVAIVIEKLQVDASTHGIHRTGTTIESLQSTNETVENRTIKTEIMDDEELANDEDSYTETRENAEVPIEAIKTETLDIDTDENPLMNIDTDEDPEDPTENPLMNIGIIKTETVDTETFEDDTMDSEPFEHERMNFEPDRPESVNTDPIQSETMHIQSVETVDETLQNETIHIETVQDETANTETIESETMQIHSVETVNETLQNQTVGFETVQHQTMSTETTQSEAMHIQSVETVDEALQNGTVGLETIQDETMSTETTQSETMHIQSVETVDETLQKETVDLETVQHETMCTETTQSETMQIHSVKTVDETLQNETVDIETVHDETASTETTQSETMHIQSVETVNETLQNETFDCGTVQDETANTETIESETMQIHSVETVDETLQNHTVGLATAQHETMSTETTQSGAVHIQSVGTVNETLQNPTVGFETVQHETASTETTQSEAMHIQSVETVDETLQNESVNIETVHDETASTETTQSDTMHIQSVETVNETLQNETVDLEAAHDQTASTETTQSETMHIQSVETVDETLQNEPVDLETVHDQTASTETTQSETMHIQPVETVDRTLQNETMSLETVQDETLSTGTTQSETMHIQSVETVDEALQDETVDLETVQHGTMSTETTQSGTMHIQSVETVDETLQNEAVGLEAGQHETMSTETIQSEAMHILSVGTANETLQNKTVDIETVQPETTNTETSQNETMHMQSVATVDEILQNETMSFETGQNDTLSTETLQNELMSSEAIQHETMTTETLQTETVHIQSVETVNETLRNDPANLETVEHEERCTENIPNETVPIESIESVNETLQNETLCSERLQHETVSTETVQSETMHIESVETLNETLQNETMSSETPPHESTETVQSETMHIESVETVKETLQNETLGSEAVQRETMSIEENPSETMCIESVETANETLQNETMGFETVDCETINTETTQSETMYIESVETVNETLQKDPIGCETVEPDTVSTDQVPNETMHIESVETVDEPLENETMGTVNTETVQSQSMSSERVDNESEHANSNINEPNNVERLDEDNDSDDCESLFVVKRVEIIKPEQASHRGRRGRRKNFF